MLIVLQKTKRDELGVDSVEILVVRTPFNIGRLVIYQN